MIGLTPRQMALLRFIAGYQLAHDGVSPTLRECAAGIGVARKSTIFRYLAHLQERGAIRRISRRVRAIELLVTVAVPSIAGAPLHTVPGPWDAR